MTILISRTDSIGDVLLTLPLCGWIKKNIPNAKIWFLCQDLTKDIVKMSSYVDKVYVWNGTLPQADAIIHVFPNKDIARQAKRMKIKKRIGSSHRSFHLTTCNALINFSRRNSNLHESQLNFKLLKGLNHLVSPSLYEMPPLIGWKPNKANPPKPKPPSIFHLIFHIKSRGSAKEWHASNYLKLAQSLPPNRFLITLTGTAQEGTLIQQEIPEILNLPNVSNACGKHTLKTLILFITKCHGMLACSTGPLHIAAISEIKCLGLYPHKKPMHAKRWKPIGTHSQYIEEKLETNKNYLNIKVQEVYYQIMTWINHNP